MLAIRLLQIQINETENNDSQTYNDDHIYYKGQCLR